MKKKENDFYEYSWTPPQWKSHTSSRPFFFSTVERKRFRCEANFTRNHRNTEVLKFGIMNTTTGAWLCNSIDEEWTLCWNPQELSLDNGTCQRCVCYNIPHFRVCMEAQFFIRIQEWHPGDKRRSLHRRFPFIRVQNMEWFQNIGQQFICDCEEFVYPEYEAVCLHDIH